MCCKRALSTVWMGATRVLQKGLVTVWMGATVCCLGVAAVAAVAAVEEWTDRVYLNIRATLL